MANIDFIFDFGSPNAYLVHKVLPEFITHTGAQVTYVPCLLGGIFKASNNQSPMMALANIPAKMNYERLEMARFIKKHDLSRFRFNPHFPVNTLLTMRGAVAAEMAGLLAPYAEAIFTAMWETGQKLDDPAVVAAVLTEAKLDGAGLVAKTQDQAVKDKLAANTQAAVARGAFGIPTFFVGEEMWFGKERLRDIADYLKATP